MYSREWVIKVSKLCNLRCKYCYEWNDLARPERMSLSLWAKIFAAIKTMSERTEAETGEPDVNYVIWHGGEPTTLPLDYLKQVVDLQRSVFPEAWLRTGRVRNRVQTNLFSLPEDKLDFLQRHGFHIGVSFDVIPGARVDIRGRPSEQRVQANMERLLERGIDHGMIVVIAAHTASAIDKVYAYLRRRGRSCALLPLFEGPPERPMEGVVASRETINAALFRMFQLWFEDGCPFWVRPFNEYLTTVVMKMLGLRKPVFDRRVIGDQILVVALDGRLYEPCADFGGHLALGGLKTQTIEEVLESSDYARSLTRNEEVRERVCRQCEYFGACDSSPMFMLADGGQEEGCCVTAQPLYRAIEDYLRGQGLGADTLCELLHESLTPSRDPAPNLELANVPPVRQFSVAHKKPVLDQVSASQLE